MAIYTQDQIEIQQAYRDNGEAVVMSRQGAPLQGTTPGDNEFAPDENTAVHILPGESDIGPDTGELKFNVGAASVFVPTKGDTFVFFNRTFTITRVSPFRLEGRTLYYDVEAGYA